MKQARGKPSLFWCRPTLFVGLLLSLCASDSAGLRLLPLPAASGALDVDLFQRLSGASRTPGPNREPSNYLQMVAGSQYRARVRHDQMQLATHAPETSCQLPPSNAAATCDIYARVISKTSAPLAIHKGRAPPRFS